MSSSCLAPLIGGRISAPLVSWVLSAAGGPGGAEPVGLGAGLEDVGVEGDPVDDRGDEAGVGEDGAPFIRQAGPDRDRGPLFPLGDDLEEQLRASRINLDLTQFVQAEQVQAAVAANHAGQDAVIGGFDELIDELGGGDVANPAALLEAAGIAETARAERDQARLRKVCGWRVYAGDMRYPDGGGLSAERRARREKLRLQAAQMFEQDVDPVQAAMLLRVSILRLTTVGITRRDNGETCLLIGEPWFSSRAIRRNVPDAGRRSIRQQQLAVHRPAAGPHGPHPSRLETIAALRSSSSSATSSSSSRFRPAGPYRPRPPRSAAAPTTGVRLLLPQRGLGDLGGDSAGWAGWPLASQGCRAACADLRVRAIVVAFGRSRSVIQDRRSRPMKRGIASTS